MERQQEERRGLEGSGLSGLRRLGWAALALAPLCCDRGREAAEPVEELSVSRAWIGEDDSGLRVVAEPLTRLPQRPEAVISEEDMLRQSFGLPPQQALLRLHLVGAADQLRGPGSIETAAGAAFAPLGAPPPGLSPRARTLWLGVVEGGLAPSPGTSKSGRRSFLLASPEALQVEDSALVWRRNGVSLPLQARTWSEMERMLYLEPAGAESTDD